MSWVFLSSVPQSGYSDLGLLLSSQHIAYVPTLQNPFEALAQLNRIDVDAIEEDLPDARYVEHDQVHILILESDLHKAQEQIHLWISENNFEPSHHEEELSLPELSLAPGAILLVPTLAYFILPYEAKELGLNHSYLVLEKGQWWRLWTALTLHADHKHLVSNLISGYFILNLLRTRFNTSTQWLSLLIFAGMANWAVDLTHGADLNYPHRSLGFSTFVFAALGMLAGIEAKALFRSADFHMKRLTPLTSAFFIVVMLGLGDNSDILAHFYGFLAGIIPGFILITRKTHYNLTVLKPSYLSGWGLGVSWLVFCWHLAFA